MAIIKLLLSDIVTLASGCSLLQQVEQARLWKPLNPCEREIERERWGEKRGRDRVERKTEREGER